MTRTTPFPGEVRDFVTASRGASLADELRDHSPQHHLRLRVLEDSRSALLDELSGLRGGDALGPTILLRIRALLEAETKLVFECYWQDLGGEAGA
jgi:hypothetical protein